MKTYPLFTIIISLIIFVFSCKNYDNQTVVESDTPLPSDAADNAELAQIHDEDQADRMDRTLDWKLINQRDSARRARVLEMMDEGLVLTSADHAHAAMVFQHGGDTLSSGLAVRMMRKAIELDPSRNKWLLAAAIDRDKMRRGEPQIYGTQFRRQGVDAPWERYELDSSVVTDAERIEYGVETLAQQREKLRNMNKKDLYLHYREGNSIQEIIDFIQVTNPDASSINISEQGINGFGYQLIAEDKNEEALRILELNTIVYPEGFNTWDSYGEILLKMGRESESLAAYKKSLELNPDNEHAKEVIQKLEK